MNILYHLTAPPPIISGTDATFQEMDTLQKKFGGQVLNAYPLSRPSAIFPRFLYGLHQIQTYKKMDRIYDLHHIYNSNFFYFPFLWLFKKPTIYSIVTSLSTQKPSRLVKSAELINTLVINNERDEKILRSLKISNYQRIRPGIDISKFFYLSGTSSSHFTLLVGSAPWVKRQFQEKGIDVLLQAACRIPTLRLIFLWRGLWLEELQLRVSNLKLNDRVEIINHRVDVNQILARCHASVVLSQSPALVKAYPHSLLESLAAGKPVLLSRSIPMADDVLANRYGEVVHSLELNQVMLGIERLMKNHDALHKNVIKLDRSNLSNETMLTAYDNLYREMLKK